MKTTINTILPSVLSATLLASAALAQTGASGNASGSVGAGTSGVNVGTSITTGTNPMAKPTPSVANSIQWKGENEYWRNQYPKRSYYSTNRGYTVYEPAYRYGVETYGHNTGRVYSDLDQEQLRKGWEQARGDSTLSWDEAQSATKDAYDRIYENRTETGATTRVR